MTPKQYLAALKKLGLTPAGNATAEALGITRRQAQRLATGERAVSTPIAKLLAMYLRYGIPEE